MRSSRSATSGYTHLMRSNRVVALAERFRSSLFAVPTTIVIAGIVLAQVGITVDGHLAVKPGDFPLGVTSTVDGARAVRSPLDQRAHR